MRATAEKTRPSWFWPLGALVVPPVSLLAKLRFVHPEKLPRAGAFVLVVNHYSEFDPLTTAMGVWRLGRAPRFMAKESLFRIPVLGAALRATGMVPVARSSSSASAKQTLSAASEIAEDGRGVIVYPEGTLTRDPDLWPMRGKTGAVRLALEAGVPLIPAVQWGVQEIMPRYGKLRIFPLRRPVTIMFGDPIDLTDFVGHERENSQLVKATGIVMDRLAEMLGELRGEKPPVERWNPAAHQQKETGRYDA
ncbi:lysophospholipid acyltransferase family protein [Microbacterium gorillae]|uniref:lysophospholipid acyltransferase family protein n=1 Tax=Microbacterium gorillae TaxID=1231063 RepID=UPI00058E46A1|nr:lysophospholipid acyltransferase family protein [Microbacterium gorillae]